jgi:integrase/recombinase XerD
MKAPIRYTEWKKLFDGFSINIVSQNYAGNTSAMYTTYASEFVFWCESYCIKSIRDVKVQKLSEYLAYLQERPLQRREGVLSGSSIKHHLFSLGLLFDYAYASGIIAYTVPFPKFILPERTIKNVLTFDEIRELFSVCENPRDTAILSLGYGCGLRRNEMHWLDTADVLTHTRMLYVREGKGRKNRGIPLSNKLVENLKLYERLYRPKLLMKRKDDAIEPAYLLTSSGMRMTGNAIYERIVFLARKTQNKSLIDKNVTPHLLRHSIATHLIERGATLEWTQAFLGHGSPDSTHIYAKNRTLKITF